MLCSSNGTLKVQQMQNGVSACRGLIRFPRVFPVIALDPPGGVHQFLAAREEGVTVGADFKLQIPDSGSGDEGFSADAGNDRAFVLRMNPWFHFPMFLLPKVQNST